MYVIAADELCSLAVCSIFNVMVDDLCCFFFLKEISGASSKHSMSATHSTVLHIFQIYWEVGFNNNQCVESQENS